MRHTLNETRQNRIAGRAAPLAALAIIAAVAAVDLPAGPARLRPRPGLRPVAAAQTSGPEGTVSAPVREGRYWTQTVDGTQPIAPGGTLRISTIGSVTVTGDDGAPVRYTLVKRVRADAEAEARRRFDQFKLEVVREGDIVLLRLAQPGGAQQSAELKVLVPRGIKLVDLQTHGGTVEASGLDGALRAQTGGGTVELDRIAGEVTARTAGGGIEIGAIGGTIRGTTAGGPITARTIGGDAVLETGGGDIEVTEVRGSVRASTAGGGVTIGRAGGAVIASTAGGSIEIDHAAGAVTANNLGGPIRVGSGDDVTVESGGGAIRLSGVSGRLRASTVVGDIYASLAGGRRGGESLLTTGGGDITIVIPAGFPLTIRAENASPERARRIVSDFPGIQVRTVGPLAVAEGSVNGGGPLVRLAGTGGTIYIRQEGAVKERAEARGERRGVRRASRTSARVATEHPARACLLAAARGGRGGRPAPGE